MSSDNLEANALMIPSPSIRHIPGDPDANMLRGSYEVDYSVDDAYPQRVIEALTGRYNRYETNYPKIERDETTNFFYYMIGHGGDKYIKIQDTTTLFAQQLADYLHDPAQDLKYNSSFLFSDSCSAGTVFHASNPRDTFMLGKLLINLRWKFLG